MPHDPRFPPLPASEIRSLLGGNHLSTPEENAYADLQAELDVGFSELQASNRLTLDPETQLPCADIPPQALESAPFDTWDSGHMCYVGEEPNVPAMATFSFSRKHTMPDGASFIRRLNISLSFGADETTPIIEEHIVADGVEGHFRKFFDSMSTEEHMGYALLANIENSEEAVAEARKALTTNGDYLDPREINALSEVVRRTVDPGAEN